MPPDLWTRLALLDRTCAVSFYRVTDPDGAGSGRPWVVTIVHPSSGEAGHAPLTVRGESLSAVLVDALHAAEARGWLDMCNGARRAAGGGPTTSN